MSSQTRDKVSKRKGSNFAAQNQNALEEIRPGKVKEGHPLGQFEVPQNIALSAQQIIAEPLSFPSLTRIQEGLLSLFDTETESMSEADLFIEARRRSGKTTGSLMLLLGNYFVREFSRDSKRTEEKKLVIFFVPSSERLHEVCEVLDSIKRRIEVKQPFFEYVAITRADSNLAKRVRDIKSGIVLATPAAFVAHALVGSGERRKVFEGTRAVVFDSADEMMSNVSIDKIASEISAARECQSTPLKTQVIITCSYRTQSVQRLKETLLYAPINITLEQQLDVCAAGDELISPSVSKSTVEKLLEQDTAPSTSLSSDSAPVQHKLRTVTGHHLCLNDDAEKFTWTYALLMRARNLGQKVLLIASDVPNCYKMQLFLCALNVSASVVHELLSTDTRSKARQDFLRRGAAVMIISDGILQHIIDSTAQSVVNDEKIFSSLDICIVPDQNSTDKFMEKYTKLDLFLSEHAPSKQTQDKPANLIAVFSGRHSMATIHDLNSYLAHKTCAAIARNGTADAPGNENYIYAEITPEEIKAYQYRCNDVLFTQCTKKRVKLETAKIIAKEIQSIQTSKKAKISGKKRRRH